MPTRDRRAAATVLQRRTGAADSYSSNLALGQKQTISALNSAGVWIPGILRLNPVIISLRLGVGIPGLTKGLKFGGKDILVEGDIAAFLTEGWMFLDTNLDFYSPWDSTMASYSLAKAYAKMSEPDFDAGMILVELDETIRGLFHPFDALRKYIRNFNKLQRYDPKRITDTLNMLSGSWLEWRYGITPLIIAVESAIKHFKEESFLLQGKLLRKRAKVVKATYPTPYSLNGGTSLVTLRGAAKIEVVKKTVSSLYFNFTQPVTFAERYGFNILNTPALAWERVPLSFVLDWFLGVGQWLQSLNLSDKRSVCGSTTSQKTTVTIRVQDIIASTIDGTSSPCGSSFVLTYEKLERRVNQAPPLLPVVNPAFLSLQRRIDAATLIWQRLPKFRR